MGEKERDEANMKRQVRRDRAIDGCTGMPPLKHSVAGEPFDIMHSEAAEWLCSQPMVRQYIFDCARDNGIIVYDRDAGTWKGVDWK